MKGGGPEVIGIGGDDGDNSADAGGGNGVLWIFLVQKKYTPIM